MVRQTVGHLLAPRVKKEKPRLGIFDGFNESGRGVSNLGAEREFDQTY